MISIKKNKYGNEVYAPGRKTMQKFIYKPNQKDTFKLSRTKFENFLKCKRCFYLDVVGAIKEPSTPQFTLNALTDDLLKKEFDECRANQIPHKVMIENGLENLVPFQHDEIDNWREPLRHGLQITKGNIIISGGVDDIWINTTNGKLCVADYKSQTKSLPISEEEYWNDHYHESYKTQLDFYSYLLEKMGFEILENAYLLVVNGIREKEKFDWKIEFKPFIFSHKVDTSWIDGKINEMINLINQDLIPESNHACENCAYRREAEREENLRNLPEKIIVKIDDDISEAGSSIIQWVEKRDNKIGFDTNLQN